MNGRLLCTTYRWGQRNTSVTELRAIRDRGTERHAVNLYPEITYQTIEGFGGAITEAVAYTWAQMPPKEQQRLLEAYYGKRGIGYRLARMSVDSCDFSLSPYAALKKPGLEHFSLERDERYILPFLRAAEKKRGEKLSVMLSPWSPPAFWKSSRRRILGGKLREEHRAAWAEYLSHYIGEYRKKGVNVTRLTVQNEPNAWQLWDSCQFTAAQERDFLRDFLWPALRKDGLGDLEIYVWDHNKERAFERAREILDPLTRPLVAGIAFHWYSGDHFDNLRLIREQFPEKKLAFTEGCVEHRFLVPRGALANARRYAHDMIGNLNAGMNLSLDWNILLDEKGGPNYVKNYCDAPIRYHTAEQTLEKTLSYYYIGHLSRYIQPGAVRIGCSDFSSQLDVTAARNPDGTLVTVLLNREKTPLPVNLRVGGQLLRFRLPGDSIATVLCGDRPVEKLQENL